MWREDLEGAFAEALACRGTVMLGVRGDADGKWVAVCSAVDGSLEVRCGEPRRGRWPWSRPPAAWARLEALGFVQRIDAFVRGVSDAAEGTELLVRALREGHEVGDGVLERVLVHPGFVPWQPPPEPDAPVAAHVENALVTLVKARQGAAHFEVGLPGRPWAWADVVGEELELERDDRDEPWRVPLQVPAQRQAARDLVDGAETPLFITLIGV